MAINMHQNTNINLNIIEMLEEKPNVIGVKKLLD